MRKVALIGYGAIGQAVYCALCDDRQVRISQVVVRPKNQSDVTGQLPASVDVISSLADLDRETDFVLETAGHGAVRQFGPDILTAGVDFGILSAGALAHEDLLRRLQSASATNGARLVILPGAIGGIDALAAAGTALNRVSYVARKPPQSWAGSPAEKTHDLKSIKTPTAIFKGSARNAALQFPKNANVVATVALAGIGFEDTEVILMADPHADGNSHRIMASGPLFDFDYTTKGAALAANPKTSALTALSAIRMLRHRGSGPVV